MTLVELKGVSKEYGEGEGLVQAVRGVDLRVRTGEFLSLMGPSGSGKSTLLQLMGGLDRPTRGEVLFDDKPLHRLSDDELARVRRREIGFVFQFFHLMPHLSAKENVALPLLLDGQRGKKAWQRAEELLERFGLADRMEHRPRELSGGQIQRVAIARALAAEPRLLLADEPTGNLDSVAGQDVLSWLKKCQSDFGQTVVMVTHDPKAAAYGDRIITLKDGKISQDLEVGGRAAPAPLG